MTIAKTPRATLVAELQRARGDGPDITATDLMVMADLHGMYGADIVALSRMAPEDRGDLHQDMGNYREAIADYERALKRIFPLSPVARKVKKALRRAREKLGP